MFLRLNNCSSCKVSNDKIDMCFNMWSASVDEQVTYNREPGNRHYTFAMAMTDVTWAMCLEVFRQFVLFY